MDRATELRQIKKDFLKEFLSNERNAEWAKSRRLEYLGNQNTKARDKTFKWLCYAMTCRMKVVRQAIVEYFIQPLQKQVRMNLIEIDRYENPRLTDELDESMIENARNYPIENILEVKDGWAVCPFHNDKNPSAFCKNNYLHCFSCDETADTIKLYMHIHQVAFPQAVKDLQC